MGSLEFKEYVELDFSWVTISDNLKQALFCNFVCTLFYLRTLGLILFCNDRKCTCDDFWRNFKISWIFINMTRFVMHFMKWLSHMKFNFLKNVVGVIFCKNCDAYNYYFQTHFCSFYTLNHNGIIPPSIVKCTQWIIYYSWIFVVLFSNTNKTLP